MLHVLAVRLDSAGDVLLAGPAVRAISARADHVTLLAGPRGRAAAELLPGVDEIMEWHCPWIDPEPGPVTRGDILAVADAIARRRVTRAVIFSSFHQDPLPAALLLRLAGVPHVTAESEDYPGSLLDVRHRLPADGRHEVERMLSVAAAAGFPPPADTRLALRGPLPDVSGLLRQLADGTGARTRPGYVVVHPGASVPARAPQPDRCAEYVAALTASGWPVAVTGTRAEKTVTGLAAEAGGGKALDLGGRTGLAGLAAVLGGAAAVVTGNTAPAHLAAAVQTPVVSLFAPTVPLERWRPWRVPHAVLGDPGAPCAGTRAKTCPVAGHPCLASVTADEVVNAVQNITVERLEAPA